MAKAKASPLMKKLIAKAVADLKAREPSLFMTEKRVKTKWRRLKPTDTMARLLRYIESHQPISFAETLGMDWRYLGGLLTRHKVYWGTDNALYTDTGEALMAKRGRHK